MTQTAERRPGGQGGAQVIGEIGPSIARTADIPRYPRGGDPRRRYRLHQKLVVRRRLARDLEALAGGGQPSFLNSVQVTADYWHDCHMDLGLPERDRVGRQLLAAGWLP